MDKSSADSSTIIAANLLQIWCSRNRSWKGSPSRQ